MNKDQNSKQFDLEDRTLQFTRKIIQYVKVLPRTQANIEIARQMIRSAGSVGANYIEANEALSRKDFAMRIKIAKKESKETSYWVSLSEPDLSQLLLKELLFKEAMELTRIFSAIAQKLV